MTDKDKIIEYKAATDEIREDLDFIRARFEEDGRVDYLKWIDPDGPEHYFPDFFRTE